MRALSIQQPWATLIILGIKPIENRKWKIPQNRIGETIFVHSSAKWDSRHRDMSLLFTPKQWAAIPPELQHVLMHGALPTSAILGTVKLVRTEVGADNIWAEHSNGLPSGPAVIYNWVLSEPDEFPNPRMNVKGALSFWNYVDPEQEFENEMMHEFALEEQAFETENKRINDRILFAIESTKGTEFLSDLKYVLKDSEAFGPLEIVKKPSGQLQSENYGLITEIWVDQWSVGTEADSYAGIIYIPLKENKYLAIRYSS